MVLFIAGRIRRDLLFLRLTGAAQVRPNFSFFCSPEEIKSASLCNWGHKYCLCRPEDTWQGEESSSVFFSEFFQVSVKATHMLIYKKGNLYFFQSLCFLCVYCCSSVFLQYKQGWGGGGGGGGGGEGVLLTYHCFVCEEHNRFCHCYKASSQLTHIWKRKRRHRCDGEKGRPKREGKTGQMAERHWLSGPEDRNERMKGSRWHRQQNERVIEVKWEREWERKGGATGEKSNMGSAQQRCVCKRACYGSPLGLPRQIVCAVSQSVVRSGKAPHGDVWRRRDGIA